MHFAPAAHRIMANI